MSETKSVSIDIDWPTEPDPVYANATAAFDMVEAFALIFASGLPPFGDVNNSTGDVRVKARISSSVRLTPAAMSEFVNVAVRVWMSSVDRLSPEDQKRVRRYIVVEAGDDMPQGTAKVSGE